jgi:hypothetical protein
MLANGVAAVDKPRMTESNFLLDALNEQNLQVLQIYADRFSAAKALNNEHDGWLDRQQSSDELRDEQLTRIHGELIAMGMLRFQLTNRNTGLQYSVSETGRETLARRPVAFPTKVEGSDSDEFDQSRFKEAA